jgi:hypothetical protein
MYSGVLPYSETRLDAQVLKKVLDGVRPAKPASVGGALWISLTSCWSAGPRGRPALDEILHAVYRDFFRGDEGGEEDQTDTDVAALVGLGLPNRFLLRQSSALQTIASKGPVVVLASKQQTCHAIIILPNQTNLVHVELPSAWALAEELNNVPAVHDVERKTRIAEVEWEGYGKRFNPILMRKTWRFIIKPVINALGLQVKCINSVPHYSSTNLTRLSEIRGSRASSIPLVRHREIWIYSAARRA